MDVQNETSRRGLQQVPRGQSPGLATLRFVVRLGSAGKTQKACKSVSIGAFIVTNTILGDPDYSKL